MLRRTVRLCSCTFHSSSSTVDSQEFCLRYKLHCTLQQSGIRVLNHGQQPACLQRMPRMTGTRAAENIRKLLGFRYLKHSQVF